MSTYKSEFLNTLSTRGYIHQNSDAAGLDALAAKGGVTAYIGFDCTAKSLHVGSLVQIMLLHWAQETGQKAIALMGGGTTRVGDPSGRDESRKMLTLEDIEDFERCFDDIHYNPVKHGHVRCPRDWAWSSFHRWVRAGVYPADWACWSGPHPPLSFADIEGSVGDVDAPA